MKIYFAGSIRGGRDDRALYLKIIEHLRQYGTVLTEHVGNPELSSYGEQGSSDNWIYDRDMSWIHEANVLVAEVSTPSLGVGYEIGKAEGLGKKILCLYRQEPNKRLSAMISGNSKVTIKEYDDIGVAFDHIDRYFIK